MSLQNNIGSVWKTITAPPGDIGGVWKTVNAALNNIGGVWKSAYNAAISTMAYFNGGYLTAPVSSDFNFGTGNFKISAYVKVNEYGDKGLFSLRSNTSGYAHLSITMGGIGNGFNFRINGSTRFYTAMTDTTNMHLVVLERIDNTVTGYVDGVSVGTYDATGVSFSYTGTVPIAIGMYYSSVYTFSGYIDDFLIEKAGTTVLHLQFNEALGSTTFTDTTGKTITTNGTVVIA